MTGQSSEAYEHYSMILEWDPRDNIYVVTVPELPGCQTHGATLEEAIKQARDALESWIDVAREIGKPIPPPRYFAADPADVPIQDMVAAQ
jgi:antitoxin HicB